MDPRRPIVLLACGAFNPLTLLHLRMLEIAKNVIECDMGLQVLKGILSPVHDAYGKADLAPFTDRFTMCKSSLHADDEWVIVDDWEGTRKEGWSKTLDVLKHYAHCVYRECRVVLVVGSDLTAGWDNLNLWSPEDLNCILRDHGCIIVERINGAIPQFLFQNEPKGNAFDQIDVAKGNAFDEINVVIERLWGPFVRIAPPEGQNNLSSTLVRRLVREGKSVRYLLPDPVIDYIRKHRLYLPYQ